MLPISMPIYVSRDTLKGQVLSAAINVAEKLAVPVNTGLSLLNDLADRLRQIALHVLAGIGMKVVYTKLVTCTGRISPNSKLHFIPTFFIASWVVSNVLDEVFQISFRATKFSTITE